MPELFKPKQPLIAHTTANTYLQNYDKRIPWIWEGLIAEGCITLLCAPEKTGKTTLLSLLLDRRRQGGVLLGKKVQPGRTIVCSEEEDLIWALRQPPLDFGNHVEFHTPVGKPTREGWVDFIDHLLGLSESQDDPLEGHYFDVLVIDTLMSFLPASQNHPSALYEALHELRLIAGYPAGVLLLHQTRTARGRSSTRGPVAAFADIVIEMQAPAADRFGRRRHFFGVGRYPGTLQHLAAELNPEGTDYVVLPEAATEASLSPSLAALRLILSENEIALTRMEILDRWPSSRPRPRADSLGRFLMRACEQGILTRTGTGTKADAFEYKLVGQEIAPG